jgi:hypothetical protein
MTQINQLDVALDNAIKNGAVYFEHKGYSLVLQVIS